MDCKIFAHHDHFPGPEKKGKPLRVGGTCEAPNPGYKLSLRAGNGGINPDPDCVYLELVVDDSKAEPPDVMTTTEVEVYEEQMASEKTKVLIHGAEPGEVTITHTGLLSSDS